MTSYNLPTNLVANVSTSHVSHSNVAYGFVNKFDKDAVPANGYVLTYDSADGLYKPLVSTSAAAGTVDAADIVGLDDVVAAAVQSYATSSLPIYGGDASTG